MIERVIRTSQGVPIVVVEFGCTFCGADLTEKRACSALCIGFRRRQREQRARKERHG